MKRNVAINGLGPTATEEDPTPVISDASPDKPLPIRKANEILGMVRINEGDAWYVPCLVHTSQSNIFPAHLCIIIARKRIVWMSLI